MEELKGLTTEEIEEKTKQGKTNKIKIKANESILKIIRKNIFTYFNLIFLILAILLITSQSYRNLTFLIIITINILIGIFQQIKSKITLDKLSLLDKNDYIVIRNGKKGKISSDNLVEGDYVILEAGNQIPADAIVVSGKMYVNESLLTGEQDEIEKNINSNLMSGSFVISGKSVVKLTKVGDESFSSKIMKDSKKIKETKSEMISAIDKIVKFAGIIIIPIGLLLFWESYIVNGNTYKESVNSMVSALIGMIPEGLYLLTTVALAISAGKLARKKVILHDMKSIESLARVDVLCVDKTGTITEGVFEVQNVEPVGISKEELLKVAAYAEHYSNHPISKSIKKAYNNTIDEKEIIDSQEISGKGIEAKIGNQDVLAGNEKLMNEKGIEFEKCTHIGSVVYVAIDGKYVGHIVIADKIKEDAKRTIEELKKNNIKQTVMLTGDRKNIGEAVAKEVGIDKVYTELLPDGKVEKVEELLKTCSEKGKLAFVGDGINDAPVLAMADIGIAMGGLGADSAIEAADIVIMTDQPSKIISAMKLSKKTMRIVRENIVFAIGVKVLVLVLTALGLSSMWQAVFADVGVSVIAILNALRALRVKNIK